MLNKTKIPDSVLRTLVEYCAEKIGTRLSNLEINFRPSKSKKARIDGLAVRGEKIDQIEVAIPTPLDPIETAYGLVRVTLHELAHVRDYQANRKGANLPFTGYRNRIAHDDRPQEQRANQAVNSVVHDKRIDSIIHDLICFLD
jgi:hypothetical protein